MSSFLFEIFSSNQRLFVVKKKVLSVSIFLLAAISGQNDFLYYSSTWFSLILKGV